MSHFTVYVFSKDNGNDIEDLLAPYDENIEMSPYVKYTKTQAIAKARKDIEDYKNSLYAEFLADPEAYKKKARDRNDNERYNAHIDYLENEFPKRLEWTDDECYEEEAYWFREDGMIDDDGNLLSTYNPKSKWDWYAIGGRWSGGLVMKDGKEVDDALVSKIDWDKTEIPFAFVTPDGEWHERGEMGWWCCVSNEKEIVDWEEEFRAAVKELSEDKDIYVTLVDCHI